MLSPRQSSASIGPMIASARSRPSTLQCRSETIPSFNRLAFRFENRLNECRLPQRICLAIRNLGVDQTTFLVDILRDQFGACGKSVAKSAQPVHLGAAIGNEMGVKSKDRAFEREAAFS